MKNFLDKHYFKNNWIKLVQVMLFPKRYTLRVILANNLIEVSHFSVNLLFMDSNPDSVKNCWSEIHNSVQQWVKCLYQLSGGCNCMLSISILFYSYFCWLWLELNGNFIIFQDFSYEIVSPSLVFKLPCLLFKFINLVKSKKGTNLLLIKCICLE